MATKEIICKEESGRILLYSDGREDGFVRLMMDRDNVHGWAGINLDLAARYELIEALTATLPVDEDFESYRQWRREVGVPVPGDEV